MVRQAGTIFAASVKDPRRADLKTSINDPLQDLLQISGEPLFEVTSVFPLQIFPDKLIIRPHQVDVVEGIFFGSGTVVRVLISDIKQVEVQFNPFLARLEIYPAGFNEQVIKVRTLPRKAAQKARRIIAGLMIANERKLNFSGYNHAKLVETMERLGTVRG